MPDKFEDILNSSLEAVLAGGESVDSCCERHADQAGELRPLLELALSSRDAAAVDPAGISAQAREAGREEALERLRDKNVSWWRRHGLRRGMLMRPVALGAGAAIALSSGTALAASTAGPGSFLFPLEQKIESAHTALTIGNLDKAKVEVTHANERLDELEGVVADGKPELIPDVLSHYEKNINKANGFAEAAAADGEDTSDVERQIGESRDRLAGIVGQIEDQLPEDLREAAREALGEAGEDENELPSSGSREDWEGDDDRHDGRSGGGNNHNGDGEGHDSGSSGGGTYEPPHQDDSDQDAPHEDSQPNTPPAEDVSDHSDPDDDDDDSGEQEAGRNHAIESSSSAITAGQDTKPKKP